MHYYSAIDIFAWSVMRSMAHLGIDRTDHVQVLGAWDETFSDTSLGRGGVAGQTLCTTLTVVIGEGNNVVVCRNGRIDYVCKMTREVYEAIHAQNLPSRMERAKVGGRLPAATNEQRRERSTA